MTVRMVYQVVFLCSVIGFHSVDSLRKFEAYHSPQPICLGRKCPAGHSSFCPQNATSRCIQCKEGTFSSHASRRKACRPCSRCRDDEYEIRPCSPTSNVVCRKCRQCPPGSEVDKSCEGKKGTVCKKCNTPDSGRKCKNRGLQRTPDISHSEGRKIGNKHQQAKDASLVKVQIEKPWFSGSSQPTHHVKPSPEIHALRSTSSNGPTPSIVSFTSRHVVSITSFVKDSTKDVPSKETLIEPFPDVQATKYSPSPSLSTSSEGSDLKYARVIHIQRDQPKVQRHTRRNAEQNGTRKASPFPTFQLSSMSFKDVNSGTMFSVPDIRGVAEVSTTLSSKHTNVEMPLPENQEGGDSKGSLHLYLAVGAVAILVIGILFVVGFTRHKLGKGPFFSCKSRIIQRRPRCPGSSNCCHSDSLSSFAEAHADQGDCRPSAIVHVKDFSEGELSSEPTLITHVVEVDVHPTVFDLFPVIRGLDDSSGSYPQYLTRAEATFDSTGGRLTAQDSNVTINVESGAVPNGVSQQFYFGVVYDDTLMLRDIPETPERSLISPVIKCGPDDIDLLKPVEIILPHCLIMDEVKKSCVSVYRCRQFSEKGPMNWEKVPSERERACHSKAWFTVKKDTVHIKTKTFSFWSVFCCGGPKRKRATVFVSKPNPWRNLLHLRFYIYSDNEDSRKRMERKEREKFPDSKGTMEKPFKMYNDTNNITVWLRPEELAKNGWELDQTDATQTYLYDMAYKNGYRTYESCSYAVNPTRASLEGVNDFSCSLYFQQEDHPEHFIYVNPGISLAPQQTFKGHHVEGPGSGNNSSASAAENLSDKPQQNSERELQFPETFQDEPVTQEICLSISKDIGADWKNVLRQLGMKETAIKNLDEDYKNCNVAEKCYQGLIEWQTEKGPGEARSTELCGALHKANCPEALNTLLSQGDGRRSVFPIQERTSSVVSDTQMHSAAGQATGLSSTREFVEACAEPD